MSSTVSTSPFVHAAEAHSLRDENASSDAPPTAGRAHPLASAAATAVFDGHPRRGTSAEEAAKRRQTPQPRMPPSANFAPHSARFLDLQIGQNGSASIPTPNLDDAPIRLDGLVRTLDGFTEDSTKERSEGASTQTARYLPDDSTGIKYRFKLNKNRPRNTFSDVISRPFRSDPDLTGFGPPAPIGLETLTPPELKQFMMLGIAYKDPYLRARMKPLSKRTYLVRELRHGWPEKERTTLALDEIDGALKATKGVRAIRPDR